MNDKIEQLREEREERRKAYDGLRQQRTDREARREELEVEAKGLEVESQAAALIPGNGGTATASEVQRRLDEIQAEIAEIEEAEEEAREAYEAAEERLEKALTPAIREQAEAVAAKIGEEREALARLGEAALEVYQQQIAPAQEERQGAVSELHALHRLLPGKGRLGHRQKRSLDGYLRGHLDDVTEQEILGYLVLRVLLWTQSGNSPVETLWREAGVEPDGGSILYRTIVPEDALHHLKAGRLPMRSAVTT